MRKSNLFFITIMIFITCMTIFPLEYKDLTQNFRYRNLGPYRTGSWISCIAVPPPDMTEFRHTFYVGARNGGVWKTVNNGTTFFPVFDKQKTLSIGDIAIDPSDPDRIWVGTGEAYNARLSHSGNGIYFSADGGKNWENMGLKDSLHISKVIVDPMNPNTIYAASMGHLFSPNEMRGVYKSEDSGKNWKRIFFIDKNTGVIDLVINPKNPDILYAAAYEKYRFPWHYEAGGENSGIYKTKDGGKTWKRLKSGLPSGKLGRIGLTIFYDNPEILYAVIENLNPRPGVKIPKKSEAFDKMKDPYFDLLIGGEVYKTGDGGNTWRKMNSIKDNVSSKAAYSFNKIYVDQKDSNHILVTGINMSSSFDGGKSWFDLKWPPTKFFINMFGDVRAFWIDPVDPLHMMIGSDGGLYVSYDGGKTVDHLYNIPLGEAYTVETDMADPYNIYVGLQDHEVWKGPSNGWSGGITIEDWHLVGMWDGMYFKVDKTNNRFAYTTTQFGGHLRVDMLEGERVSIEPKRAKGLSPFRFPWTPPLIISPHNPQILFAGSQFLLMSVDRGDHWKEITGDLTTNNSEKIAGKGHIMYCTITSVSESPLKAGLIWAGTDDGKVHLISDYGKSCVEVTKAISETGCPENFWVTSVLSSYADERRAYVTKSGFKFDNFTPYILRTDNLGESWENIAKGLPESSVNVIVEDEKNPDLLFAGLDCGIFVSFTGGNNWVNFNNNIPSVPVKDITIQSRESDLVVGTYGRGVFVTDISPLRQLTSKVLKKLIYLFPVEPKPKKNYSERIFWGNFQLSGDRPIITPNEKEGSMIYYYIGSHLKYDPLITIKDIYGKDLISYMLKRDPGLHPLVWKRVGVNPGRYIMVLRYGKYVQKREIVVKKSLKSSVGSGVNEVIE